MQSVSGGPLVLTGTEPRRLAAFVHADMVGYSRLIEQDDVGTQARLARLRHTLINPALERYGAWRAPSQTDCGAFPTRAVPLRST